MLIKRNARWSRIKQRDLDAQLRKGAGEIARKSDEVAILVSKWRNHQNFHFFQMVRPPAARRFNCSLHDNRVMARKRATAKSFHQ